MHSKRPGRAVQTIGPSGAPLTLENLPPPDTKRWVVRYKAELVAAVRGGLISLDEACERYQLSTDEFLSWADSLAKHGVRGLRSTKIQQYRKTANQKTDPVW